MDKVELEYLKPFQVDPLNHRSTFACSVSMEGDSHSCYFMFSRAADLRRHVEYWTEGLQAGTLDRLDEASGKE